MSEPPRRFINLLTTAEDRHIPLEVSIEITSRCNFRCGHCYLEDHRAADTLTTERLIALFDELAGLGCLFLSLTGGEVAVRHDWLVLCRQARRRGFSLRLFTNAALITAEDAAELKAMGIGVEVSLYSMEGGVFDRIAGVDGAFEATMRGIGNLHAAKVELKLKTPVMRSNRNCIHDVERYAGSIGAEFLADPHVFHRRDGAPAPVGIALNGDEVAAYLEQRADAFAEFTPGTNIRDDLPLCAAGSRTAHVSANGEVRACSLFPEPAGRLGELSFTEIWRSSRQMNEIRTLRRPDLESCDRCEKLPYCRRCHAIALVEDGDLRGPSRWSCDFAHRIDEINSRNELTS